MRRGMVRLGNTDLRIGPRTSFAGHLESSHTCDVGLQSYNLQIEHQFDVILPGRRYAGGTVEIRQHGLTSLLFRLLNTPLDFADGIDVLSDLRAVPRTQFPLKARHVFGDPIEDATVLSQLALAVLCRSSVTKEAFENHARICFGRKRVRGRRPG